MRIRASWPLLAIGLVLSACGSDEEVAFPGEGAGGGGLGGSGASGASGPAFVVPDLDDDDGDGLADYAGAPAPSDNDVTVVELPADLLAGVVEGDAVELSLAGDAADLVLWLDGEPLLGATGANGVVTSAVVGSAQAHGLFEVTFGAFRRKATLHLRHLDAAQAELAAADVDLWGAPLVLGHHLQPAEHVWVVSDSGNAALVSLLQQLAGERLTVVQNPDVWIQDELEWGTATAPGQRLDVAIDSIRDRELDAYVKSLAAPDVQPITWGQDGTATTEDKFGNLETMPPHEANGTNYPFGRVYYGDNGVVGPNATLKAFLDEQRIQSPIQVDTSWLCVGHVDEFMAFIPDATAPRGFKLVYADIDAGYALLGGMDPATALPHYASTHGYATVGAILGDAALHALNDDVQADYLDPILAKLTGELELSPDEIVRAPSLFERIPGCAYSNAFMEVAALIPGVVNFVVVNPAGEASHVVLPDPFLRPSGASQASDPLIQALEATLPAEHELHFVDDWWTYHASMGEVHCGTNVLRTPGPDWWTTGLALLGGAP